MKKSPLISICIPVYNGAQFLSETIQSALSQNFSDFEIVIIDDCSTDNSISIISKFARVDSRIVFFKNSIRLGLVGNWNECIKKSRGQWVKFIFQDDLLEANCLEKLIHFIENSKGREKIFFCKRDFFFEDTFPGDIKNKMNELKFIWDILPKKSAICPLDTIKNITRYGSRNLFGEPSSFLIHRKIFEEFGLFDSTFHHICDYEYWLRIGVNKNIIMLPDTLIHFRVHNKSATSFNLKEKYVQLRYLERLRLFLKFLNDDHYLPLRRELTKGPCKMFLKTKTSILARRAKIDIQKIGKDQWKKDFADFCIEHPDILKFSNMNFFLLAIQHFISKTCVEIKWFLYSINNVQRRIFKDNSVR